MSKKKQDKRRARAKEKKMEKRKREGKSPLARLDGRECVCWRSDTGEDSPMVSFAVIRKVAGGGWATAFFLIDYDCIGLKDAFYHLDMTPTELEEHMMAGAGQEMEVYEVKAEEVREEVGDAIGWTKRHAFFRMPAETERCLKILGGVAEATAEGMENFGTGDGGLFYSGLRKDLERRLVGLTVDEFLEMEGVGAEFVTPEMAKAMDEEMGLFDDEEEGEEGMSREEQVEMEAGFERMKARMIEKLAGAARKWCEKTGKPPADELERAAEIMMSAAAFGFGEEDEEEAKERGLAAQDQLLKIEDEPMRAKVEAAMAQLGEFVKGLNGAEEMMKLMGDEG